MENKITVLIVDDNLELVKELSEFIKGQPDILARSEARKGEKSAELTPKTEPANSCHDLEKLVTEFMRKLGVSANLKGYRYIRTAIMMTVADMDLLGYITKRLYPEIAKVYASTSSRVERAIRHAIEKVWDMGNQRVINDVFGYTVNAGRGKPTNSEFIAMIADKIRLQIK